MTDSTTPKNPALPEARGANWYSRLSLISSIAGAYIGGSAETMQELRTTSVWGGLVGIAAVILGISGLRYSRILRKGRGLAITGIVIGTLVGIGVFRPLIDDAMQSRTRDTAKRLIGHPTPSFSLKQDDGTIVSDTSLKDTVYILDFTTNPKAFHKLDSIYRKHMDDGLKVFSVFHESMRPTEVLSSFPPKGIGFPVLFDNEQGGTFSAFRASRNAQTVLVGRDGIIAAIFFNAEYDTEFDDAIRKAINR